MKVHFTALGCRLNEAELETWSHEFSRRGHQMTTESQDADLIVFNSCSVTAEADRKSRKLINRTHRHNPRAQLVVTGCYASLQQDAVRQHLGVDLLVDNSQKEQLVDLVVDQLGIADCENHLQPDYSIFKRGRHRAFIKVQDGCRYRCTYCVVTLARGEERSRSVQAIVDEVKQHHRRGVQEIVLTGVHVGGYGSDRGDSLYRLIAEILQQTEVPRVRLASVEPWDLPGNFFSLFSDSRLMPHMHLPLQSGSDSVLRRMARRCKTDEFARLVDRARCQVDGFNVTTDLIVGFPGESDQEWRETLDFVERVGFGDMHIFSYSARAGTKAAGLPGQIEPHIKKQRSLELHELADEIKLKQMSQYLGGAYEILWERQDPNQQNDWVGYTPHYFRVMRSGNRIRSSMMLKARLDSIEGKPATFRSNASQSERDLERTCFNLSSDG